ncbi:MAG: aminotransferase class IV [Bacteroidales bacterium]
MKSLKKSISHLYNLDSIYMNYLETIKIADAHPCNLEYHVKRMEHTIGRSLPLHLQPEPHLCKGLVKCRVVYNHSSIISIEYLPYHIPVIKSLTQVECNNLDYHFKYQDRMRINQLKSIHCNPEEDILIIKNGFITDTSFCNIVFENNQGLFTPSTPLLNGTKRQYLLDTGQIQECVITKNDFHKYSKIRLINAMIDLHELVIPGCIGELCCGHSHK